MSIRIREQYEIEALKLFAKGFLLRVERLEREKLELKENNKNGDTSESVGALIRKSS
jgi:uncharacterized protein (UPF0335 family)